MVQTPIGRLTKFAIWSHSDDPIHLGAKAALGAGQRFGLKIGHRVGSQIHQQATWVFQRFFDAHKEGDGAFAIHNPVIVTQS